MLLRINKEKHGTKSRACDKKLVLPVLVAKSKGTGLPSDKETVASQALMQKKKKAQPNSGNKADTQPSPHQRYHFDLGLGYISS